MIEAITGSATENEIRRRIITPLKLTSTYMEGFEDVPVSRVAKRYHCDNVEFRKNARVS